RQLTPELEAWTDTVVDLNELGIPDPYGRDEQAYRATAAELESLIRSMTETETVAEPQTELQIGYAGTSIPRKEDKRLVQGEGVFADDVKAHGMGYVHIVRSPYAHARIVSVHV